MAEKVKAFYRIEDNMFSEKDFDFHSHEKFEIYYFHSGNCKYLIGNQIYQLKPNDIIIMNGMTLHRANPFPTMPYIRSVIEFSAEWIHPILNRLNVPELLNPFNKLNNMMFRCEDKKLLREIEGQIGMIAQLSSEKPNNLTNINERKLNCRLKEAEIAVILIQLLIEIYKLSKFSVTNMSSFESEKESHVNRIKSWIDQHFTSNISLDDVSENLHISKYYMSRIFKEVTGYTVMQYLMSRRMNQAKYLLEIYPNKSITDVGLESGFESSSHFSRLFRKQVNMTPSEYRNKTTVKFTGNGIRNSISNRKSRDITYKQVVLSDYSQE